jgi:hypothetical protein
MNNANAAAKARRAGIKPTTPVPTAAPAAAPQGTTGLTLPQVISVIDRRLVTLETFMKETKENPATMLMQGQDGEGEVEGEDGAGVIVPAEFNAFVDEINNRFQMLASEIETMKNALLKLQTFTMDVNRSLLERTDVLVPASVTEAVVPLPEVTITDPVSVADESVTADAPVEEPSA